MLDVTITLVQMAFVATILTVALEQVFDTRLYQRFLGKGIDGNESVFFKGFELRPWISTAAGIFVAITFELQAISIGLGQGYLGSVNHAGAVVDDVKIVDMVLTGLVIGGGTKSVKKVANMFAQARQAIEQPEKKTS
jgi:hypothetical protein